MALSATIYKLNISLSDLNRDYYDNLNLTLALHPSETLERLMARVLAFCIHACDGLEFTKGLSSPETPDIWLKSLNGQIQLWIELGEPLADKLKKATRVAEQVVVYSFNSKSATWWAQEQKKAGQLDLSVFQLQWSEIQTLASQVERTMALSVTITENSAFVATGKGESEVHWQVLQ